MEFLLLSGALKIPNHPLGTKKSKTCFCDIYIVFYGEK